MFDTETANLGMRLEKNIKEEFSSAGFTYFTNVKDNPKKPTLEIDGIAVKGNQCFVIESKVKGITKMIEEQHTINEIIIDLKGIVDGFENLRRKRQRKRIPSLLKKIEFAKKHLSSVCNITQNNFKIKGMIITIVYPWISEYKGVEIVTYD